MVKNIIISTLLLLQTGFIRAQTISWTGVGNGETWSDINNWNPRQLPDSFDHVLIENATQSVKVDLPVPQIASLDVNNSIVQTAARMTINNADTFALNLINATIEIESALIIFGSAGNAILIDNQSLLENKDSLLIYNPDDFGIDNNGNIKNNQGSVLIIEDALTFGPLRNNNIFENFGTMHIRRTNGILNNDQFRNKSTGKLHIDNLGANSVFPAFFNQGDLENDGLIKITNFDDDGIYQQGLSSSIINNDSITIDEVGEMGVGLNGGMATNNGLIYLKNVGKNGINFQVGTFENNDTVKISNCTRTGILMDYTVTGPSHLMNQTNGVIQLDNITSLLVNNAGIRLGNPGEITNAGKIYLNNCGNFGLWITDAAQFFHNDGTIQMSNMPDNGFFAEGTSQITVEPPAILQIATTGDEPFSVNAGVTMSFLGIIDIVN